MGGGVEEEGTLHMFLLGCAAAAACVCVIVCVWGGVCVCVCVFIGFPTEEDSRLGTVSGVITSDHNYTHMDRLRTQQQPSMVKKSP